MHRAVALVAAGAMSALCACGSSTAELSVFICPNFPGACGMTTVMLDQSCASVQGAGSGTCFRTGLFLEAGRSYKLTACKSCNVDCGTATTFATPDSFRRATYYPQRELYCETECIPPAQCP